MPVNPNEAPAGFVAVETTLDKGCDGCALLFAGFECTTSDCLKFYRVDLCNVIFVPRTDKPATANFPHDDMGTPV